MNPKTRREVYKPIEKTVVTELKHFVVDNVRRVGAGYHSVATKINKETLEQKDIIIDVDSPYVLKDVHHVVSIQTPFPIIAEFTGFGEIPEPEVRTEQKFTDAEISIGDAYAGRFIPVTITDGDEFGPRIEANVVNLRTGETEKFTLTLGTKAGVYEGYFQTQNNDAVGVDFDGVMYCRKDDILRVYYLDPYGADGKSLEVVKEFVVGLDFKETEIQAPTALHFDSYLNLRILNPISLMVSVTNLRTGTKIDQMVGNFQPIHLTYDDGEFTMSVQDNDVIRIDTSGKDLYGDVKNVTHELTISGNTITPVITEAKTLVDMRDPYVLKLTDYNLPENPTVTFTNGKTGLAMQVPLVPEYQYSGRYTASLQNLAAIALPGEPLQVLYTSGLVTLVRNVEITMGTQEIVEEETPLESTLTAPLRMTINGQFFLNGSFAGTIKLIAIDGPVRCTLIKA